MEARLSERTAPRTNRRPESDVWALRMVAWAALAAFGLAAFGLVGCTSGTMLESKNVGPNQWKPVRGTSYYLPKKLLRVQVWRYGATEKVVDKQGKPVKDASGQAQTKKVFRHFALHKKDGSDEIIIPDHRHQYVIAPQWDVASHDYLKVTIAPDGLLSEVHGDATDERTEIAAGIGDLFSMLISGSADGPRRMGGEGMRALTDEEATEPRFVAEFEFDPIDPTDRHRVETTLLSKYGIRMSLTRQPNCPTASSGAGCCQTCDVTKPGIYYRLPIPYRFTLSPAGTYRAPGVLGAKGEHGEWESLDGGMEYTILLPNEAICMYVPVTRAAFVKSHTSVFFERGMLLEVETDKPSELLGFVRIPIDAASAILAIPAELLTLRIKETKLTSDVAAEQAAANEAQRLKIESELALLKAAQELRSAKADPDEYWNSGR